MPFLTTWPASWLRLSRREQTLKTAEILILRHYLALLKRQQPRRALLSALPGAEHRTRLRAEWTAGGRTERFFDSLPKGTRSPEPPRPS
jgi:hypothetical protein